MTATITPRRGRPPVIDLEQVVDAALAVIERDGAERLTMKALADQLGVSPMAAYRHVSDKQALIDLVVGRALTADVASGSGEWDERLWQLLWPPFANLARYPGLVDYLYKNPRTHDGRLLLLRAVELVREAGFEREEAKLVVSDVYAYLSGRVLFHARATQLGLTARSSRSRDVPTLGDLASESHIRHGFDALVRGLQEAR